MVAEPAMSVQTEALKELRQTTRDPAAEGQEPVSRVWELAAETRKPCLQARVSSGLFLLLCSPLCKLQSRERLCDGHMGVLGTTLDGGWAEQLVGQLSHSRREGSPS